LKVGSLHGRQARKGGTVLDALVTLVLVAMSWLAIARLLQWSLQRDAGDDPDTALRAKTATWRDLPLNTVRATYPEATGPTNSRKTVQHR
jgi:hypothetical protein